MSQFRAQAERDCLHLLEAVSPFTATLINNERARRSEKVIFDLLVSQRERVLELEKHLDIGVSWS